MLPVVPQFAPSAVTSVVEAGGATNGAAVSPHPANSVAATTTHSLNNLVVLPTLEAEGTPDGYQCQQLLTGIGQ